MPAASEQRPSQLGHIVGPAARTASRSSSISASLSGSNRRAASAFSWICSLFRIVTHEAENRSSVQIAWKRPWAGVSLFALREGTCSA